MTARSGRRLLAGAFGLAALFAAAEAPAACTEKGRVLGVGFFPDFAPVSYSADRDPASAGFDEHRGGAPWVLTI